MSTTENQGNTYELRLEAFLGRINRTLHRLIPYRELFYDYAKRDYYVRIVSTGPDHLETQGPYYYVQMVGLARMIGALNKAERAIPAITLKTRGGSVYQEQALPSHLKFDVLTPVLHDALVALHSAGWTVQPPATAAVTEQAETAEEEIDVDMETGEVTAR